MGALVFDIGSSVTRAGFAGEDTPKVAREFSVILTSPESYFQNVFGSRVLASHTQFTLIWKWVD